MSRYDNYFIVRDNGRGKKHKKYMYADGFSNLYVIGNYKSQKKVIKVKGIEYNDPIVVPRMINKEQVDIFNYSDYLELKEEIIDREINRTLRFFVNFINKTEPKIKKELFEYIKKLLSNKKFLISEPNTFIRLKNFLLDYCTQVAERFLLKRCRFSILQ